MTPTSPHRPALRRSASVLVAFVTLSGAPFVARAIGNGADDAADADGITTAPAVVEPASQWPAAGAAEPVIPELAPDLSADPIDAAGSAPFEPAVEPAPAPAPPDPIELAIAVLTDGYVWDERGARVEDLQRVLGITVDGGYGLATLSAHRRALESAGLPTDRLPLAPGPSATQWEALRRCESGGDYSITSSSGKYRGAYQFDRRTWNSVAERHAPGLVGVDPAAAAPVDQDAMALALHGERGSRPWPNCGRHLR